MKLSEAAEVMIEQANKLGVTICFDDMYGDCVHVEFMGVLKVEPKPCDLAKVLAAMKTLNDFEVEVV